MGWEADAMPFVWKEKLEDVVEAPPGMVVLSGVRRRVWRSTEMTSRGTRGRRRYELSAYLGRDEDRLPMIRWDCQVWDHEEPLDFMTSGNKHYGFVNRPVSEAMLRRMIRDLEPTEVTGYTMWGSLLVGERSQKK